MSQLKPKDLKLLAELLKDSHRSDREIAKTLRVSQPTVTRKRKDVEKRLTDGYTVIPKWKELGFEIVAINFVKHHVKFAKAEEREEAYSRVKEWMMKQRNVILAIEGQGMGYDGVFVSFHKNYSEFAEFIKEHNSAFSDLLLDTQSFISSTSPKTTRKPFHLKYLASIV